jgi:hypothetical protein
METAFILRVMRFDAIVASLEIFLEKFFRSSEFFEDVQVSIYNLDLKCLYRLGGLSEQSQRCSGSP